MFQCIFKGQFRCGKMLQKERLHALLCQSPCGHVIMDYAQNSTSGDLLLDHIIISVPLQTRIPGIETWFNLYSKILTEAKRPRYSKQKSSIVS